MTGLMFSGIAYSRLKTTLLWVAVTIALAAYNLATSKFELHGIYGSQVLIYYFLTGILTYHWRHIIVINVPLLVIALAGAYVLMETPQTTFVLLPLVNMYIMVSIGMMRFPPVKLLQGGDYS